MAQVRTERTFIVTLNKEEFLLVSKALRGTLDDDEKKDALDLQEMLAKSRHSVLNQELLESQKLIVNIENERRVP